MNFLPIVNRELSVAARKRSTFWLRVAAALAGLVIGGGFLLLTAVRGGRPAEMGAVLFNVLAWLCLAAGLSAGLFLTSDCLSEEKREGTLGLLFLTDLRGYDVALGKLLATSLQGFYALLAIFPILAITLLMGGVSGAQYWKSVLALVNALFISLAAGMAVSALSRDAQKALTATLLVLLALAFAGPMADWIISIVNPRGLRSVWSLSSPGYVLAAASAWGRSSFWNALAITHGIGWGLLVLACALVPHTWQERKRSGGRSARTWAYAWRYGGARRRRRLRRRLLDSHPVAWLTCRERWQSLTLWILAILAIAGLTTAISLGARQEAWILWNYLGGLFTLLIYLAAASQSGRFLLEARRSGLLELLLVAPLSNAQILRGQWRGLLRMFGLPVALLLGVHLTATVLAQFGFQRIANQASTLAATTITNQNGTVTSQTTVVQHTVIVPGRAATAAQTALPSYRLNMNAEQAGRVVLAALAAVVTTVANLLALCWFGMWMGMTSRSANLATLKTILFVQIIPWFVIAFGSSMLMGVVCQALLGARGRPSRPRGWPGGPW